jgi:hypothetical protein
MDMAGAASMTKSTYRRRKASRPEVLGGLVNEYQRAA